MSRERMWRTEVVVTETMRDGDRCVLVVTGDLDMDSVPVLARSLSVALRDVGRVIVDVSRLGVAWAPALQVFPSALALMGGWPQARMVLCGADDGLLELLHELRVADEVPVVCDEDAARERLLQPPTRIVRCYDLCPEPGSLRRARELVRVACRDWGAGEVADDAVVVASELVGNAVEHAGTLCRLTLTLDRRELTVAVRDGRQGTIRRLRPVEPLARRGRGLLLTAGVSRRWGVTEHEQGKTVWAVLPVPLRP